MCLFKVPSLFLAGTTDPCLTYVGRRGIEIDTEYCLMWPRVWQGQHLNTEAVIKSWVESEWNFSSHLL